MAVEILGRDAGNLYAAWKDVFLGIALEGTDEHTVAALRRAIDQHATRHARFPVVFVIAESAAIPDSMGRKLIAQLLTDVSPHVVAWALVQEGSGFRAAIVRSARAVLSASAGLSRTSGPAIANSAPSPSTQGPQGTGWRAGSTAPVKSRLLLLPGRAPAAGGRPPPAGAPDALR